MILSKIARLHIPESRTVHSHNREVPELIIPHHPKRAYRELVTCPARLLRPSSLTPSAPFLLGLEINVLMECVEYITQIIFRHFLN
jgi:hypothetical protein